MTHVKYSPLTVRGSKELDTITPSAAASLVGSTAYFCILDLTQCLAPSRHSVHFHQLEVNYQIHKSENQRRFEKVERQMYKRMVCEIALGLESNTKLQKPRHLSGLNWRRWTRGSLGSLPVLTFKRICNVFVSICLPICKLLLVMCPGLKLGKKKNKPLNQFTCQNWKFTHVCKRKQNYTSKVNMFSTKILWQLCFSLINYFLFWAHCSQPQDFQLQES